MQVRADRRDGGRFAIYLMAAPFCLIIFFVSTSIATKFSPAYRAAVFSAQSRKLECEFNEVQTAVLGYYTEYSVYPVAADNAKLIKMLDGLHSEGNSRQIAFVTFKADELDAKGELLDPWGTSLQLSVDADGKLHARSAGPDETFGTADDIIGHFSQPGFK